jgi:hypothetical protein
VSRTIGLTIFLDRRPRLRQEPIERTLKRQSLVDGKFFQPLLGAGRLGAFASYHCSSEFVFISRLSRHRVVQPVSLTSHSFNAADHAQGRGSLLVPDLAQID